MKWYNRRLPPLRIATFIGILHLFIGILGAGIISACALYFIYKSGEQASLRELEDLSYLVGHALEEPIQKLEDGSGSTADIDNTLKGYFEKRPGLEFAILRPDGSPLFPASRYCSLKDVSLTAPEVRAALANTIGRSIRTCPRGVRMLLVATTIHRAGDLYGVLVLAAPFDTLMAPTYQTMRWMGVIGLLIVAFTVVEGWQGSIYISRPVVRLSRVAEQLSQGNLKARAGLDGPLEVSHLAQTLNVMAARLSTSLESMRAFVANASHELRTPLTSIRLQVDALRNGACEEPEVAHRFLDQIESEIDRLAHSINEMLDLSNIEGGVQPMQEPVNLRELVSEAQAFWETRSRQAELALTLDCDQQLPQVTGDPHQLRRLIDNLLDNAIKNTLPGGKVEISLHCCQPMNNGSGKPGVRIEVRDTGRGIAPEHLPHIFERFYRIDARPRSTAPTGSGAASRSGAASGSGLGLAIAQSIVQAHGGMMGVSSQVGCGAVFWIELPVR